MTRAERDRITVLARSPKPGPAGFVGDPYPFGTCCVDEKPLGGEACSEILADMRDAFQEGRQVKFCCEACKVKFHASPDAILRQLDQRIIAAFGDEYPFDRCLVILENKLGPNTETFVLGNRVYKAASSVSATNFRHSWGRYASTYDKAVAVKQRSQYPLETCVVTGTPLPEKPYDLVIGAHLLRVTDAEAAKVALNDPRPYLAKLEAAQRAASGAK